MKRPVYLSASADPSELRELEAQREQLIEENKEDNIKLGKLNEEKKMLERIDNKLREEKQELQKKKGRKGMLENHIQLKTNS